MHCMPSGHVAPLAQSSAHPLPPSSRIASHTTAAVPVAGGGRQSHGCYGYIWTTRPRSTASPVTPPIRCVEKLPIARDRR